MNFVTTYTGIKLNIINPLSSQISIDDIAHNLSLICRYNGSTKYLYSVAQHSLAVYEIIRDRGLPLDVQLSALLHDATEAYLCDIPRPLKQLLNDYNILEKTLNDVIASKYNIKFDNEDLIYVDNNIVGDEIKYVLNHYPDWGDNYTCVADGCSYLFKEMNHKKVENEFKSVFYDLVKKLEEINAVKKLALPS